MNDYGNYLDYFCNAIIAAKWHYDIWWLYSSKETRPQYINLMNKYVAFFRSSISAHFTAMLIELYKVYETRNDTYNIPTLLKKLKNEQSLENSSFVELDFDYNSIKPLWVKTSILRNEVFAHRSSSQSVAEAFKKADITPNQIKELIKLTQNFIIKLSTLLNVPCISFTLGSHDDTKRLLDDLNTLQKE